MTRARTSAPNFWNRGLFGALIITTFIIKIVNMEITGHESKPIAQAKRSSVLRGHMKRSKVQNRRNCCRDIEAEVARTLYALRTDAGLSQRELAKLVGTPASAICRLEDSDYDGHSLAMLRRIAALEKRVEIRSVAI